MWSDKDWLCDWDHAKTRLVLILGMMVAVAVTHALT